jgi:hypothetical protein
MLAGAHHQGSEQRRQTRRREFFCSSRLAAMLPPLAPNDWFGIAQLENNYFRDLSFVG